MNIYQMRHAVLAKHIGERVTPAQLKGELLKEFLGVKPQSVNEDYVVSLSPRDSDLFTPSPEPIKVWTKVVIKHASWVAVVSLVVWQVGCGDGTIKQGTGTQLTPGTPGTPAAKVSISPAART
jgi:hypothetical protein